MTNTWNDQWPCPEAKFARKIHQLLKLVNLFNFTYQKKAFWLPCYKFLQDTTVAMIMHLVNFPFGTVPVWFVSCYVQKLKWTHRVEWSPNKFAQKIREIFVRIKQAQGVKCPTSSHFSYFLAHLGYFPMSLCNHDSWIKICMASVYAPPGQSINLSNFIFCRYIT